LADFHSGGVDLRVVWGNADFFFWLVFLEGGDAVEDGHAGLYFEGVGWGGCWGGFGHGG